MQCTADVVRFQLLHAAVALIPPICLWPLDLKAVEPGQGYQADVFQARVGFNDLHAQWRTRDVLFPCVGKNKMWTDWS